MHVDPISDADDSGMPRRAQGIRDPPSQTGELHSAIVMQRCYHENAPKALGPGKLALRADGVEYWPLCRENLTTKLAGYLEG